MSAGTITPRFAFLGASEPTVNVSRCCFEQSAAHVLSLYRRQALDRLRQNQTASIRTIRKAPQCHKLTQSRFSSCLMITGQRDRRKSYVVQDSRIWSVLLANGKGSWLVQRYATTTSRTPLRREKSGSTTSAFKTYPYFASRQQGEVVTPFVRGILSCRKQLFVNAFGDQPTQISQKCLPR